MSGFGMEPEPENEETGFQPRHEAQEPEEPRFWLEYAVGRQGSTDKWYDDDGNWVVFCSRNDAIEKSLELQEGKEHLYHDVFWVMTSTFLGVKAVTEVGFDLWGRPKRVSCAKCLQLMETEPERGEP